EYLPSRLLMESLGRPSSACNHAPPRPERHPRPARAPGTQLGADARLRDRELAGTRRQSHPRRRRLSALPSRLQARGARPPVRRMGRDRKQQARPLLLDHDARPRAPAERDQELGAVRRNRHRDPHRLQGVADGGDDVIRSDVRRLLTLKLRRRDWEREVEDEIRLHLELRAESLAGQGMPADRATAEAIRRFGSLTEARARLVDAARHREQRMQRVEFWSTARQDLAFAVRTLGRNKTWTAVAVLTLGLGIGATTSVFSATSSLLLHPLPYPDADRVVIVQQQPSKGNNTGVNVSISPNRQVVSAWMSAAHSFQDLEPYDEKDGLMRTHGDPSPVHVAAILPSFLRFAGVRPVIGRVFSASEVAAHAPVLLLGEDAWRTRFGSDPAVLGRAITIDDTAYAIVGVVPQVLRVPSVAAKPAFAWTPLNMADAGRSADVVGRLARGASVGTATRELESIQARVLTRGDGPGVSFTTILLDPSRLLSFRQSLV